MKLYYVNFSPARSDVRQVSCNFLVFQPDLAQAWAEAVHQLKETGTDYWGSTPHKFSDFDELVENDDGDYWYGECYPTHLPFDHPDAEDPPMACLDFRGDTDGEPTTIDGKTRFHIIMDLQYEGYNPLYSDYHTYKHFWDRNEFMEWAKRDQLSWES